MHQCQFHGEIVTKGSSPKCFQAYGIVFFTLGRTVTGSHNDPLLIVKNLSCVDGRRNTCIISTTQCTLGTIQDGGRELAKQCFSSHISRVRTKELLYDGNDTVPETIVTVKSPHKIRNVLNIFVVMICASRTLQLITSFVQLYASFTLSSVLSQMSRFPSGLAYFRNCILEDSFNPKVPSHACSASPTVICLSKNFGSLHVSGKRPTYPSLNPTFCFK